MSASWQPANPEYRSPKLETVDPIRLHGERIPDPNSRFAAWFNDALARDLIEESLVPGAWRRRWAR